jgi:hypothetical protein
VGQPLEVHGDAADDLVSDAVRLEGAEQGEQEVEVHPAMLRGVQLLRHRLDGGSTQARA